MKLSLAVIYGVLGVVALITLIPFLWMIASAFKTTDDFFTSLFLPSGNGLFGIAWDRLTLDSFRRLFVQLDIGRAILNSVFLASVSAVLSTLCAAMGGYALAKLRFPGRASATTLVLASMTIPGALLIAPSYTVLFHLGLLNSFAGLILPGIAPAFGIFLFRQAMLHSVPSELLESARIDGAGEIRTFFQIVIPLVRPMIGAFMLITFLGAWNNFIGPQIIFQSQELFPLSVALNQLKGSYNQDYGLIMAGTLVSIAPILVLFLLLQKEFIAGLTAGAVKG
jgi:ABC-type glycerol-3-phosphate transport system permease component